jgi:hypothetical protein
MVVVSKANKRQVAGDRFAPTLLGDHVIDIEARRRSARQTAECADARRVLEL